MDLTKFIETYVYFMLNFFKNMYSTLNSITFMGISVIDYSVTLLIIGVMLPIIVSILQSRVTVSKGEYRSAKARAERRKDKQE